MLLAGTVRASEQPPTLAIGAAMPPFSLPGIDGKTYTDKSFAKADILVMVFTCAHCPTAQAYEERIKKLVTDYQPKNVTLIAINPNHADAVRLDELAYSDLSRFLRGNAGARQTGRSSTSSGSTTARSRRCRRRTARWRRRTCSSSTRRANFVSKAASTIRSASRRPPNTTRARRSMRCWPARRRRSPPRKVFGCSVKWADKVPDYANYKKKWAAEPVTLEKADAATLRAIRENKDSGKIRFINVWATWCGPCITEFDELVEHNLRFRIRPFEMVTIAAEFPDQEAGGQGFPRSRNTRR